MRAVASFLATTGSELSAQAAQALAGVEALDALGDLNAEDGQVALEQVRSELKDRLVGHGQDGRRHELSAEGVAVDVRVGVRVGVTVAVGVGVAVDVRVAVAAGVDVCVGVRVAVAVAVWRGGEYGAMYISSIDSDSAVLP